MFVSPFSWDVQGKPAPQPVTEDELLTVARALKGAGLEGEGIYRKIEIFAEYARNRTRLTGKRYIVLKAE